jgi:hypothetical protein
LKSCFLNKVSNAEGLILINGIFTFILFTNFFKFSSPLEITCKDISVQTLDKYKEKLIDYEFSYAPRPFESLKILQDKLTAFKEYPLQDYLTKHKINNIRIISRIINALNDFYFIQTDIQDAPEVETEIVSRIIEVAAINAQTASFDEFIEYANQKSLLGTDESDKFEENEKYESLLSLIEGKDVYIKAYFLFPCYPSAFLRLKSSQLYILFVLLVRL